LPPLLIHTLVVCSCARSSDGESRPCSKSPSVGTAAVAYPTLVCLTPRGHRLHAVHSPSPPPGSTISDTVENSVCSKQPLRLNARPWNVKASTICLAVELCWPWCPDWGTWPWPQWHTGTPPFSGRCSPGLLVGRCHSSMMGWLGVEGIATPEVKFLDRCKTTCSEGVLQVPVRRSRM